MKIMKKLLLSLAIVLCASVGAKAQGNIWVGGSLSVVSSKAGSADRTTDYSIMPEIGMGLSDNLGVGVQFGYGHEEADKTNTFKIAPFARYKFLQGDLASLFVDGGVMYQYSKPKGSNETNIFGVGFKPGVMVNVSEKFALILKYGSLGYAYGKTKGADKGNDSFGLDLHADQAELGVVFAF